MIDNTASDEPELTCETFTIKACHKDKRLDFLLKEFFKTSSRSYFQKLIQDGLVLVNGSPVKKSYVPEMDDEVQVQFALTKELEVLPEDIPLDILYEDEHMLAINKPSGMVVHPGVGNWTKTFVNALLFYCKAQERYDEIRPGVVHRLDKDTTGVLLAAKTYAMHKALSALFASRNIEKEYLALALGKVPQSMTIATQIGRHPIYRKEMAVLETGGKEAKTHLKCVKTNKTLSLVSLKLETGRTHQIRVHLKHIGCPLLGDPVYGNEKINAHYKAERQMLHAASISFVHPMTGQNIVIKAPLPHDMSSYIEILA